MTKFSFNAAARAEAIKALNHLRTKGSPLTVLAGLLLSSVTERLAVTLGALLVYLVCTAGIVFIKGLDTKKAKPISAPRTKVKMDDTS